MDPEVSSASDTGGSCLSCLCGERRAAGGSGDHQGMSPEESSTAGWSNAVTACLRAVGTAGEGDLHPPASSAH